MERENQWHTNEDLRREVLIKEELKAMQAHQLALEQAEEDLQEELKAAQEAAEEQLKEERQAHADTVRRLTPTNTPVRQDAPFGSVTKPNKILIHFQFFLLV
jgi:hypothetical protein